MKGVLELFQRGDVYLAYPFEDMRFRYEKSTDRIFSRYLNDKEVEVPHSDRLFNDAISAGKVISRDEYSSDSYTA